MSAQRTIQADGSGDEEMLDVETSAALMRCMETALGPDGIDAGRWQSWAYGGCKGPIEASGVSVTPAMLGQWARTGALR
jgi:hypothetical protein